MPSEVPMSLVEAGIPVAARLKAELPVSRSDCPAMPPGTFVSGRVYPDGELALTAADPRPDPLSDTGRRADSGLGHGLCSFPGTGVRVRSAWQVRLSLWIAAAAFVARLVRR